MMIAKPKVGGSASTPLGQSPKVHNKFLMWQRGLRPRVAYRYRIVTDVCLTCFSNVESYSTTYAKRGKGKLFVLYCPYHKCRLVHLYIEHASIRRN